MKKINYKLNTPPEPVAYIGAMTKGLYFQDNKGKWLFLSPGGSLSSATDPDISDRTAYEPIYSPVTITIS